jgi:nitroreductase
MVLKPNFVVHIQARTIGGAMLNNPKNLNISVPETMDLLLSRRSGSAKTMTGPGPSPEQLETILTAATRVPDHGKLTPWRFIVFEGEARERMGEILAEGASQDRNFSPAMIEQERQRFLRAPVVIAVVSRVKERIAIPVWEQQLSSGAVCQTILIAAHAMGFVAQWITEWYAYDLAVLQEIGLTTGERIAGFIYIGQPAAPIEDRPRPDLETLITRF